MVNENQRKTFISYSRVNTEFALKLAKELRVEGFSIWFDQLDIPAGSRWDREVEKALKECEIFMIIMTPAAIASENVLDEIGYAIDHGKKILPILLEMCDVPLRLRRFQYVDFTNKGFKDGYLSAKELLQNFGVIPAALRGEQSDPVQPAPAQPQTKPSVLPAPVQQKTVSPKLVIGIAAVLIVAVAAIGVLYSMLGAAANRGIAAPPVTPVVADPNYKISCIVDDPDGSMSDNRDVRLLLIPKGSTVTVTVSDCSFYYARGAISPLGEGVEITQSVAFTVTGGAYLSTYIPGQYGFDWTFASKEQTSGSTSTP